MSLKLLKNNLKQTEINFNLPADYVIAKFYELGYKVSHSKYTGVYNCCCPICREGKSWGKKKRCFYIPENDNIYCHNCGWSSKPFKWISTVSGMNYDQIFKEITTGNYGGLDILKDATSDVVIKPKSFSLPDDCINLFDVQQIKHYQSNQIVNKALEYIKSRRLDTAINRPDAFYISLKDFTHKNRLIVPFKDCDGKIVFYQSRKLFEWDKMPNYISKTGADKSICGMDKVSDSSTVFLFEGPFDSFFVKNGLAIAGITKGRSNLTPKQEEQMESLKFYDKIWVLDSQWLDETAREKTKVLIDMGEKVFIWPKKIGTRYKDFNEMCIDRNLDQISEEFIKKNSSQGLTASLKFKMTLEKI